MFEFLNILAYVMYFKADELIVLKNKDYLCRRAGSKATNLLTSHSPLLTLFTEASSWTTPKWSVFSTPYMFLREVVMAARSWLDKNHRWSAPGLWEMPMVPPFAFDSAFMDYWEMWITWSANNMVFIHEFLMDSRMLRFQPFHVREIDWEPTRIAVTVHCKEIRDHDCNNTCT